MLSSGKSLKYDFVRFVSATIASLMVFSVYSMVDGLMVSIGVNEYAMSAVNLAIPFTNALFSIAILFAVGTSTLIAFYLAQEKRNEADTLFSQNLTVLLFIGAFITIAVLFFLEPFAILLGADDFTLDYVKEYLTGLGPFSVCFLISYNLEILVKTDGYPRYALFTVITGCAANCVMDYVAIFWMGLGVFGAAVATGLSQLLTCIIYFAHFHGKQCTFHFRKFHFDPFVYKRLLPIGFADGVTELCTGVMIFLFNRTVLRCIGTDGVVTYTVIAYVNTVIINVMVGISQGSQPLMSYFYGKKEYDQCTKILRYALIAVCIIAPISFCVLYAFAPQIVSAFLSHADGALIEASIQAFRRYSFSYLIVGFNIVIGGIMAAVERPRAAICISVGRGLALQSAALLFFAVAFGGAALWYTPIISEMLCLCLSMLFLKHYMKSIAI